MKLRMLIFVFIAAFSSLQANEPAVVPSEGSSEVVTRSLWPSINFNSPTFNTLYTKLSGINIPSYEKLSQLTSGLGNYIPRDTSKLPEALKVQFDNLQQAFTNLPPTQQAAIVGAVGVMVLYQGYKYYSAPSTADKIKEIDASIYFLKMALRDPYSIKNELRQIQLIRDILDPQKERLLKILNVSISTSSLTSEQEEQLKAINEFFALLYSANESPVKELSEGALANLQKDGLTLYYYLLKARAVSAPETLQVALQQINRSDYQSTLTQTSPLLEAYFILQKYNTNLSDDFTKDETENIKKTKENLTGNLTQFLIEHQSQEVIKKVFGGWLYRHTLMSSEDTDALKKFQEFFGKISEFLNKFPNSTGQPSFNDIRHTKALAKECLRYMVNKLPEKEKWEIVRDYLLNYKKEAYLKFFNFNESKREKTVSTATQTDEKSVVSISPTIVSRMLDERGNKPSLAMSSAPVKPAEVSAPQPEATRTAQEQAPAPQVNLARMQTLLPSSSPSTTSKSVSEPIAPPTGASTSTSSALKTKPNQAQQPGIAKGLLGWFSGV